MVADFNKLICVALDAEGSGVIYSLRKAEVLERWVLHADTINSAELEGGRLLTASSDYTAKVWLLWK